MSERLPGGLKERLRELKDEHNYDIEYVAKYIGVNRSTYSRYENGDIATIKGSTLAKLAELYNVSIDYIMGLSRTPEKTYDDIKTLGLSIEAAKNLCSDKVDSRVVNELLLNKKFALVTKLLGGYYTVVANKTYEAKNKVLDFNYNLLTDLIEHGKLPDNKEIRSLAENIKTQKEPTTQADIEKIKSTFMTAVKEIKEKVVAEVQSADTLPTLEADFIDQFKKELDMDELVAKKTVEERISYIASSLAHATYVGADSDADSIEKAISGYEILLKSYIGNEEK